MKIIGKKNIRDILALTPMQEGMLYHYLLNPKGDIYFEQLSLSIGGPINIKCFEQAWNVVIETNEMLRVVFRWKTMKDPVQIVLENHDLKPEYYDLSAGKGKKTGLVEKIKARDKKEKFDLENVPCRVKLCKIDKQNHVMIMSYHHILFDGWSTGIILGEFLEAYDELSKTNNRPLKPPVKTRFKEYIQWLQNRDVNKEKVFWKNYLGGFNSQTGLSIKQKKKGKDSKAPDTGTHHLRFERDKLEDFVKKFKITLALLLYSAWGLLLQKYNNSDDVIFGTTAAGRSAKVRGIEDMVGLFINTLPLRIKSDSNEILLDFLHRTDQSWQVTKQYEATSLANIKEYSEIDNKEELFDSIVIIENYPLKTRLRPVDSKITVGSYSIDETTHYDLTVAFVIFDEIEANVVYNKELFEEEAIVRLSTHFKNIIEKMIKNPGKKIHQIDILSEEEKRQLLFEFNDTRTGYPLGKTIDQLFEEQVERIQDNIAVVGPAQMKNRSYMTYMTHISYRELNKQSTQLAHLLKDKGVLADTIVGIMVERSLEMIIGILGILKAASAYLPIDPDYPEERIKYMLADSSAKFLVTTPGLTEKLTKLSIVNCQLLMVNEKPSGNRRLNTSPKEANSINNSQLNSSNLAYIIYTSGTTGGPKGVMVQHSNLVTYLAAFEKEFHIMPGDTVLQQASYSFDTFGEEVYPLLLTGGAIAIPPAHVVKNIDLLVDFIRRHNITIIDCSPLLLNELNKQVLPADVRLFISGGDVLRGEYIENLLREGKVVYNTYGPTETTVCAAYSRCEPGVESDLPIGKPIANYNVYILDKNKRLQPIGICGELCISSPGVTRGYLNNPGLTFERFINYKQIPNYHVRNYKQNGIYVSMQSCNHAAMQLSPHHSPHYPITPLPHHPIYRTGDLARWQPGGNIEFLGRMDHQVKLRGFRIELGEIENRLLEHPAIKEAVVIARDVKGRGENLCAYIVSPGAGDGATSDTAPGGTELKEYLSTILPGYMIPSYFTTLHHLPLTPGGKIDRKALPEPGVKSREKYHAPRNKREEILVGIWSEILGIEKKEIGIHDNFFELGGHSLKAMTLVSRIHKELNVKVSLEELFKTSTIRGICQYITEAAKDRYREIAAAEQKEYYILSSAQKRLYFLQQMDKEGTAYNMHSAWILQGGLDRNRLKGIFAKLIQRHESLRTSFVMVDEAQVQRVHKEVELEIRYYDVSQVEGKVEQGDKNHRSSFNETMSRFVRAFDFSKAPLMRVGLVKLEKEKQIMMVDLHHIIADGTSIGILIKEFMVLYLESAPGSKLPPLKLQYKDYSEWLNSREKKEAIKKQEVYWLLEFGGEVPVLDLPIDFPRPLMQSFVGDKVYFTLDPMETKTLKIISRENDVTLYMTLLAVFNILFSKLSGQEDIIVGTPIAARRHMDLQHVVGMLVNSLPMRNFPWPAKPFRLFLEEIKQRTLDAYENQEYPFEELVDQVSIHRDTSRNPIFDIMFALWDQGEEPGYEVGREVTKRTPIHKISRFDLAFDGLETEGKIEFCLEYCTKLFKPATIEKFIKYYKKIIAEIAKNQEQKLADIEIIPREEKEEILRISNGVEESGYQGKPLHRWFERQVEKTPDRVAVTNTSMDHIHISYEQLNKEANQLAHLLREKGTAPGCVVGVMIERSVKMITAILAILKSGGAYLPIDPRLPGQRLKTMLTDSRAFLLLTSGRVLDKFSFSYTQLKNLEADDKNLVITPPRQQIKELDRLPITDRTLVDYEKYHRYVGLARAKHTISLQATRGCPYQCLYCHKIWPKKHMMRSAHHIFEEVRFSYEAGVRRFSFVDDIFNLHEKNSGEFLRKIINHAPDVQLYFPNGLRGDILTKDFIDLMIEAGTIVINLALETASPRLQKRLGKNLNLGKFQENVHYIANTYPHVVLDMELMIGFPTETEEEALQTLEMLKSFKWIHFPGLNILKIYPNTDMYRFAIENGVSKESIEKSTNLAYQDLPETLPFSKNFTRQYQAAFMNEYFLLKDRLLDVLPVQMKTATEDELVQKYDSYLPLEVKSFSDILQFAAISKEELGKAELKPPGYMDAPGFNKKIRVFFPGKEKKNNAFKILLLDLSLLFSRDSNMFYDMIEEPLGLMALLTYLDKEFKHKIQGKVAKSRIDFDSFEELKALIRDFKPGIIGIRTLSYYKEFFHKTVLMIRQWGFKGAIAAGGPYATSDYSLLLQDESVNLVVMGEGELTFTQLIEKVLENDHQLPGKDILSQIPGIVFAKDKDKVNSVPSPISREIILPDEMKMAGELAKYPVENLEDIQPVNNLLYLIYTSGSTGNPKGVMLEQQNLINLIYYQFKHTNIDFSRVLQFTTIGFDVSAQEIFSTLLAGGQLFLIHEDTLGDIPALFKIVKNNNIQTIFLPASFLKFVSSQEDYIKLLPSCIKHIITAGEQAIINDSFRRFLQRNNVYFHNHYGPSETHVVTALTLKPGDEIPVLPAIGRPVANTGIYLLDKGWKPVPCGVPGELFIAGLQVGRGYLNNPEMTNSKFQIPNSKQNGIYASMQSCNHAAMHLSPHHPIYLTGDLARWLPDWNIEFLGRRDHQVKIRGFRIELGEIENHLLNHDEIKDAVVVVKTGKNEEKYLCAYICSHIELSVSELREYLAVSLPDYMIPTYFVFLEKIPLTSTGKVDRKALPQPGTGVVETTGVPRDKIEMKLTEIWSEVLGIKKELIGIDTNFFELGGHSLNASTMVSVLHKELNVKVPLSEIFRTPHIRGLSGYVKTLIKDTYTSIESVEKKEYYVLSSAQKRLYIEQQRETGCVAYNIPAFLVLEGEVDKNKLGKVFKSLIQRHENLRTSFEILEDKVVQRIHHDVQFEIEFYESGREVNRQQGKEEELPNAYCRMPETIIKNFIRPFDLSRAPLLRVGMIAITGHSREGTHNSQKGKENRCLLMVDMHHIITDGISMAILVKEFSALYSGQNLAALKTRYCDFSEWQNRLFRSPKIKKQEEYWLKQFEDGAPAATLPTDYPRSPAPGFKGEAFRSEIDGKKTAQIRRLASETETTLHILLLAVFITLISKYSGQEDIVVGFGVSGRRHTDLENVIGMFVNMIPTRNQPRKNMSFIEFLQKVKTNALNAYENQDYPFEELLKKLNLQGKTGTRPLFDVVFQTQNISMPGFEMQGLTIKPYEHDENKTTRFNFLFYVLETGDRLDMQILYSPGLFKRSTVRKIAENYREVLDQVLDNNNIQLEHITISNIFVEVKSTIFKEDQGDFTF